MFYIRFYNFDKKVNSLKVPGTSDDFTRYRCNVKTASSIINPVIELQKDSVPVYNYCFIEEFKRYYFITDITFSMGMWIISTACDTLASFREDIMNSRQYVMRSASSYNPDLIDTLYLTDKTQFSRSDHSGNDVKRKDQTTDTWSTQRYFNRSIAAGCFVLGIYSANLTGVTYYGLSARAFKKILAYLFTYKPTDLTDFSQTLGNSIWNPIQYICSCRWFPALPLTNNTGGQVTEVNIGGHTFNLISDFGFDSGYTEDKMLIMSKNCTEEYETSINLPIHPDASLYPYMKQDPFTTYNLYFQPFGDMPIDTTKVYGASKLNINWIIDFSSGSASLKVYTDTGSMVFMTVAEIGVTLPITSLTMAWEGAAAITGLSFLKNASTSLSGSGHWDSLSAGFKGLASAVTDVFRGYAGEKYIPAASNNLDLIGTAQDVIASTMGQTTTKGAPGSFLSYNSGVPFIYAYYRRTVQHDDARFGRPLHQNKRLDNLSGFCICANAYVSFSGCPALEEKRQICEMLNSGVFIE